MRGAASAQFDDVTRIVTRDPGEHYWLGGSADYAARVIESLPLELQRGKSYLFQLKDNRLLISEATTGIIAYRPTDLAKVVSISSHDDATHLAVRGISGIEEIVLLKRPVAVSGKALTIRSLTAPVELLDEYGDLRAKEQGGALTPAERSRREELIQLIGKEYERRARSTVVPSSRSIPASCGESRSSGYRSTGG